MAESISNVVYLLRTKEGLTQEALAHKVGVSRQTIIAIERGNYTPSVLLALKLSNIFRVSVNNLFKIKEYE
jgi:putative transcriptional regulator